ncbi:MAG: ribonuclease P protein component [Rickettsiales bacterium]|jgi:ribonuclease P protein component|nr:ribonuclease P protein component [Rickettsiales bacterium]
MKILSIKSRKDFLRAGEKTGIAARGKNMVILSRDTDRKYTEQAIYQRIGEFVRIGLVVTKKISKKAVVRNRIKRRIRAINNMILLNHCNLYINNTDYVIVLRRNISDVDHLKLLEDIKNLLSEIRVKHERNQ